ncbi:MAG: class I SAM-dependent methyltransferase [Glaciimonas sp.]|nr:class I SAM-dependent methyltransferase [Glaciimonas sp.]
MSTINSNGQKSLMSILRDMNLNISTNPRGTDKGDFKTYVKGFYEKEFGTRQMEKNRLFEIGVRSGASIALWANFFKDVELIGADVEQVGTPVGPLKEYLDYQCVKFFCQDAYSSEFANSLTGKFSIMIDDGPHSLSSQKRFIELYLSKLDDDGVMIIEDVQREYRDSFQLMMMLPGNKYLFEIYDFRSQSRTGDDFLFVVRHNINNQSQTYKKVHLTTMCLLSWLAVPFRRLKALFVNSSK